MHPYGTTDQSLLPPEPSHGSHQRTMSTVTGIVVEKTSNDPHGSTSSAARPKSRPLNLADNYEIVGGVPTFVWKSSPEYNPAHHVYAISSDDTYMAIREGWHKLRVYDLLDNFSLVAEWENTNFCSISALTFHNNQNNDLVVVFRDSTVALMSLSHESKDEAKQPNTSQNQVGTLEIKQKFYMLDDDKEEEDFSKLRYNISNHGEDSWVCISDLNDTSMVALCSIRTDEFQTLYVKSDVDIVPTFVRSSIPEKALMLVTVYDDCDKPRSTRIWTDLDFDAQINEKMLIELNNRQGFDFSGCGSYFLAWNYSEHGEDAMEAYDVRLLRTSTNPIARISIGRDVLRAGGQFIEQGSALLEVLGHARPEESVIAAFLVASSSKVELTLWDVSRNEVFKNINLTMREMTFSHPFHVEFSISPNMKWVCVGCWTDGVFGLFSLLNGALVWNTKLNTSNRLAHIFIPLKFDFSSSRLLINACNTLYVFTHSCLLDLIGTKAFAFEYEAMMSKEGFEGLWLDYRALLESRILNKSLEWKTCELEIPIDVFNKNTNDGARVGTSNSISEWQEAFDQGTILAYWKSLHGKDLKEMERGWSNTTTTTIVVFFTVANICKIGLNGIVRFLLMQGAPTYIFKTPILKWVIAFKWEKVWKKKSLRKFAFCLCLLGLYSMYSIWIAFSSKDLGKDMVTTLWLTMLLFVLMIHASRSLYLMYVQVKTYINDLRQLFGTCWLSGMRKYWNSPWNLVGALYYVILLLIIPALHCATLLDYNVLPLLYAFVALGSILIWIKVWNFVQAFETTGAFVLMIENVIKDCVPFLILAFIILAGFSLALFVLFQHSLQEKRLHIDNGEDDEMKKTIKQCFGDPAKAMVTLFYAMIGTFEPKVYYHSGSLSPIITFAFVLYLTIQMIVMVNMLIAIMGDTFDRVKSTEEEQLLMGRARFIDACEAQLNKNEIEKIENSIGKYLYVLFPKSGDITDDTRLWQGRVKTIEEKVGKMIRDLQKSITKKLAEEKEELKKNLNEIMKNKEVTKDLEQIKEDTKNLKKGMATMQEDLQLIKDEVLR